MYEEYLAHYGVKGMRWRHRKAIRRLNLARRNQIDRELEIKELERMERQEKNRQYSGANRAEKQAPPDYNRDLSVKYDKKVYNINRKIYKKEHAISPRKTSGESRAERQKPNVNDFLKKKIKKKVK